MHDDQVLHLFVHGALLQVLEELLRGVEDLLEIQTVNVVAPGDEHLFDHLQNVVDKAGCVLQSLQH